MHYALRVDKNYQQTVDAGPSEFQFLRARGCLTNPFRTLSLCFGVIDKTSCLISVIILLIVCIGHVLARCDSIFPLLRCQGVWNKTCTQLSLSQILFQNPKNYSLEDVQKFCYHFYAIRRTFFTKSSTAAMFTSVRVDFGQPPLSFSTSSLQSRNPEYHLKTFDQFRSSFP